MAEFVPFHHLCAAYRQTQNSALREVPLNPVPPFPSNGFVTMCNCIFVCNPVFRQTLSSVTLSGPTLFTPLLRQAAAVASQPPSQHGGTLRYNVMLILTDGCIMDMQVRVRVVWVLAVLVGTCTGLGNGVEWRVGCGVGGARF